VSNLKEDERSEGSSLGTTRQLDYTTRARPVIKTLTKKSFSQPSAFGDTEESTGSKIILPHWEEPGKHSYLGRETNS
jgi:hypothetical protein